MSLIVFAVFLVIGLIFAFVDSKKFLYPALVCAVISFGSICYWGYNKNKENDILKITH